MKEKYNYISSYNWPEDINDLISKQQNYAKIARNLGTNYSALSNAFEIENYTNPMPAKATIIINKVNIALLFFITASLSYSICAAFIIIAHSTRFCCSLHPMS